MLSSQEKLEETNARQSLNSQPPRPAFDSGTEKSKAPADVDSQAKTVWYYARNRVKCGPYRFDQLQEIARQGSLTPADMVLQEGSRRWVAAGSLDGLFPHTESNLSKPPESGPRQTVGPAVAGYEILGILGEGGMGIVYKARQVSLKRIVALKMIRGGGHAGDRERARFRLEAEAVARLQHPHIVQIHEVGTQDGLPFFSLEFVDGTSLKTQIAGNPQPPREAAQLVETLARAMHHAHMAGVVHRDLKPANILLQIANCKLQNENLPSDNSQFAICNLQFAIPKITDFGLAKQLDEDSGQTQTGQVMGSPSYMAPEQAAGKTDQLGPLTDVYALGAILYELLTGRPPFKGTSVRDTLEQVCSQEPVPPGRFQPRLPRDLETICLKCLQKEPPKRYPSALALAEDLHRFVTGEAIQARPVSSFERLAKWVRRKPTAAALLAVSFLAVLGLFGWVLLDNAKTRQHSKELMEKSEQLARENRFRKKAEDEAQHQKKEAIKGQNKAVVLAEKAKQKEQEAIKAGQRAEAANEENRRRSIQMTVGNAERLLKEGDLARSLLYAVDALRRDDPKGPRQKKHRLRIMAALRQFPRLVELWIHPGKITHAEVSPDGKRVLTAGLDGTVIVWALNPGKPVKEQARMIHRDAVIHAVFSPDGRRVLTGSDDRTARVWEAATGRPVTEPLKLRYPVLHVAFNPRNPQEVLAVCGNKYSRSHTVQTPTTVDYQRIVTGVGPNGVPRYTMIPITRPGISQLVQPMGYAQVWNCATGQPVGKPMRARGWISSAAFSPDGRHVVTASGSMEGENAAQVWEVKTGKRLQSPFRHRHQVHQVCYSPDGKRLVTVSGPLDQTSGTAQIWDPAKAEQVGRAMHHGGAITQVAFSPDGRAILTASSDATARVWDAKTGEAISPPLRHKARLNYACFSPDGRRVLTAGKDGAARVWHALTAKPLSPWLRHGAALTSAAFRADGRQVLTADETGGLRLWDLASAVYDAPLFNHSAILRPRPRGSFTRTVGRRTVRTVEYLGDLVVTAAFFRGDGKYLFTGSGSRTVDLLPGGGRASTTMRAETDHVSVWNVHSGKPAFPSLKHEGPITPLCVSPDGRRVVTAAPAEGRAFGTGVKVNLCEVRSGKVLAPRDVQSSFQALAFAADGRCLLVTTTGKSVVPSKKGNQRPEVRVVDVLTNAAVVQPLQPEGDVEHAAFSPEGDTLATVTLQQIGQDKKAPQFHWVVTVWDLKEKGRARGLPLKQKQPVTSVVLSPGSRRLVAYTPAAPAASSAVFGNSSFEPGATAFLYQVQTGKVIPLTHSGVINHVAFSEDGRFVATASADRTARVWYAANGKPASPSLDHQGTVNQVAFGPDGLLVTAASDNTARVWDMSTGGLLVPPLLHSDSVLSAAFDAEGKRLVTACCDCTARLWDFSTDLPGQSQLRQVVQLLAGHQLDESGGFTPLDLKTMRRTWQRLENTSPWMSGPKEKSISVWHKEELEVAESAGEWSAVSFHLDRLIRSNPTVQALRVRRAFVHARLEEWPAAADNFAKAVELGSKDISPWYGLALLQCRLGKTKEYRRTCAGMVKQFGKTEDTQVARLLINACTLSGDALDNWGPLVDLAKKRAAVKYPQTPLTSDLLGKVLFRAGRYTEAADLLKIAVGGPRLFLAMAQYRLNRKEEARQTLEKVLELFQKGPPNKSDQLIRPLPWHLRLEWEILRQEANMMMPNNTGQ
jgi:WD40 repeat protein/serine/threonine protein kinase